MVPSKIIDEKCHARRYYMPDRGWHSRAGAPIMTMQWPGPGTTASGLNRIDIKFLALLMLACLRSCLLAPGAPLLMWSRAWE